jgi:hypothetical protein
LKDGFKLSENEKITTEKDLFDKLKEHLCKGGQRRVLFIDSWHLVNTFIDSAEHRHDEKGILQKLRGLPDLYLVLCTEEKLKADKVKTIEVKHLYPANINDDKDITFREVTNMFAKSADTPCEEEEARVFFDLLKDGKLDKTYLYPQLICRLKKEWDSCNKKKLSEKNKDSLVEKAKELHLEIQAEIVSHHKTLQSSLSFPVKRSYSSASDATTLTPSSSSFLNTDTLSRESSFASRGESVSSRVFSGDLPTLSSSPSSMRKALVGITDLIWEFEEPSVDGRVKWLRYSPEICDSLTRGIDVRFYFDGIERCTDLKRMMEFRNTPSASSAVGIRRREVILNSLLEGLQHRHMWGCSVFNGMSHSVSGGCTGIASEQLYYCGRSISVGELCCEGKCLEYTDGICGPFGCPCQACKQLFTFINEALTVYQNLNSSNRDTTLLLLECM